ncbi:MAG: hypothetical protein O3A25_12525 [Acidobacteria bacterium]|nr:hypothetical protein [Acidobacteriota bacterium]
MAALMVSGMAVVATAQPVPLMMTVGCVEADGPDRFVLTGATEPAAIAERVPDEPPADAALGDLSFRLVGTLDEFGVESHVGHKVWVKGLLNPGDTVPVLNLTSITHLSPSCDARATGGR